ncbi:hypothetical protein VPH35_060861 [Triticum aestivum]|uniref:Uncharacterized protein n=1 Tax=Aegilops tauschii subsp. strangulata TaxID=200361 RepID=A0A453FJG6_AEGTS
MPSRWYATPVAASIAGHGQRPRQSLHPSSNTPNLHWCLQVHQALPPPTNQPVDEEALAVAVNRTSRRPPAANHQPQLQDPLMANRGQSHRTQHDHHTPPSTMPARDGGALPEATNHHDSQPQLCARRTMHAATSVGDRIQQLETPDLPRPHHPALAPWSSHTAPPRPAKTRRPSLNTIPRHRESHHRAPCSRSAPPGPLHTRAMASERVAHPSIAQRTSMSSNSKPQIRSIRPSARQHAPTAPRSLAPYLLVHL